ncbi:unnamed protein product [Cylicocyclus nassatus]|uniref:Major facilitator superfamily (MFS) profile domain-containing protein n=1 Tax=Cylicocyclus nassatus TaxID=53992 RepID=A0AA36DL45_CYLNA|nr:unnamed protein product [Cylicocyclus nassatus]
MHVDYRYVTLLVAVSAGDSTTSLLLYKKSHWSTQQNCGTHLYTPLKICLILTMIEEDGSKDVKSGEGLKPQSVEKSSDEKSGDMKPAEDKKTGESASKEMVSKPESKSTEGKLSSEDKRNQTSAEKVIKDDDVDKARKLGEEEGKQEQVKKKGSIWKMSILIAINVLNYMDRFTVAGVLSDVQAFYSMNDAQAGLLQTAYMVFFMLVSPVWGFYGDRYNRKHLMTGSLILWTCTVLLSTFIPKSMFWLFVIARGVIALGEAGFSTVAPSVVADMFAGGSRSRMLMLFYFAMPCGSGLGFIIGGRVAALAGHWTWGVRITFVVGAVCIAFMAFFLDEPERGAAEKEQGEILKSFAASTYYEDLKALATNLTYIFGTAGYTAIVFTVGTLSWWVVVTVVHNEAHQMGLNHTHLLETERKDRISLIFGAITCVSGIVGVALGSILSMLIRNGVGPFKCVQTERSDPIVCAVGSFLAAPLLYLSMISIPVNMGAAWVLFFFTITVACFNWAIIVNMMMDIIIPPRRNVANSWQIMISHTFGDAFAPYIVGLISDAIRGDDTSPGANFYSLIKSFYLPNALLLVSGIMFFFAACTFVKDNKKFKKVMGVLQSGKSDAPRPDTQQPKAEAEKQEST